MKGSEWSLIFFTLLMQLAVGWVITFSVLQLKIFGLQSAMEKGIASKLTLILIPVILIALFTSFLHLGSPFKAIYALNNIANSWLSVEVLFALLFSAAALLLAYSFNGSIFLFKNRNLICFIASVTGILLLFSMSKLYMLETVPVWNKLSTPILFASSSIILGGLLLFTSYFLFSSMKGTELISPENIKYIKGIITVVSVTLLMETIVFLLQPYTGTSSSAEIESNRIILEYNTFIFWLRIALNVLALAGLIFMITTFDVKKINIWLPLLLGVIIILSEIIGRYLFYAMYSRIGM